MVEEIVELIGTVVGEEIASKISRKTIIIISIILVLLGITIYLIIKRFF